MELHVSNPLTKSCSFLASPPLPSLFPIHSPRHPLLSHDVSDGEATEVGSESDSESSDATQPSLTPPMLSANTPPLANLLPARTPPLLRSNSSKMDELATACRDLVSPQPTVNHAELSAQDPKASLTKESRKGRSEKTDAARKQQEVTAVQELRPFQAASQPGHPHFDQCEAFSVFNRRTKDKSLVFKPRGDLAWARELTEMLKLPPDPSMHIVSVRTSGRKKGGREFGKLNPEKFRFDRTRCWLVFSDSNTDCEMWGCAFASCLSIPSNNIAAFPLDLVASTGAVKLWVRPQMTCPIRLRNHILVVPFATPKAADAATENDAVSIFSQLQAGRNLRGVAITPNLWIDSQRNLSRSPLLKESHRLAQTNRLQLQAMIHRLRGTMLTEAENQLLLECLANALKCLPPRREKRRRVKTESDDTQHSSRPSQPIAGVVEDVPVHLAKRLRLEDNAHIHSGLSCDANMSVFGSGLSATDNVALSRRAITMQTGLELLFRTAVAVPGSGAVKRRNSLS